MTFGSTAKNVNLLSITSLLCVILGMFYFEFSLLNLGITIASFYVLNILGVWMMLHRFYSHKSFEFKNKYVESIFLLLSVLAGRGSPISWVYIHRQHHAYSDTDKDPHSPNNLGYKIFGFGHYKSMEQEKMKIFLVKDLMDKTQLFIHKYYILFILSFALMLSLYSLELMYFMYAIPLVLIQLSQNHFNYFGHTRGYRNFDTKDNSTNNFYLFPFILGESWHNNHHAHPNRISTTVKSFELDPVTYIINMVSRRNIVS